MSTWSSGISHFRGFDVVSVDEQRTQQSQGSDLPPTPPENRIGLRQVINRNISYFVGLDATKPNADILFRRPNLQAGLWEVNRV